ncbi:MAG: sulfotransferase family 2 domain-containing protein [Bacteroidota bacterium]
MLRQEFKKDIYQGYEKYTDAWSTIEANQYEKYVFLRNPIDRFFSAYFTVYNRHIGRALYNQRHGIIEDRPHEFLRMEDTVPTIFEFLEHIREYGFFDPHIKPQIWYLKGYEMNAYFSVENAATGVNTIRSKYGLPLLEAALPRINPVPRHKAFAHRKEDMPSCLIDEIKQLYADDIALYDEHIQSQI